MLPMTDSALTRDGKIVILPMDHGLEHGPTDFETVPETIFEIATHDAVTGLAVGKGIAEAYYPSYEDDVTLLAKLNGASNLRMGEPYSPKNWSVERAVDIGADVLGYTVYAGSNHEPKMFEEFRDVQEEARAHGLPVAMWSYPRGQGVKNDTSPSVVAYAARIALELGADVAKVKYPGDRASMEWAVRSAGPTRVVMSGGSKDDDEAFLRRVESVIEAGGAGLAVGRNIFQRENPERILDALEHVIFEEESAETALAAVEE